MKVHPLSVFLTLLIVLALNACNLPYDGVINRPPTPTPNPITDVIIQPPAVGGELSLTGRVEPAIVWQCANNPELALAYIYAELKDPERRATRVIAANKLVHPSGDNSGSLAAVELTRGVGITPSGAIPYSGVLDTSGYDQSRFAAIDARYPTEGEQFSFGLTIILQALDSAGVPIIEADAIVTTYRKDCDPAAIAESAGKASDPTPTSGGPINFVLTKNAVCRSGPSMGYEIKEYIAVGDSVPAEARSEDGEWLVVTLPNQVRCWVSILLGNPEGDPNRLPVEEAPALVIPPTPKPNSGGGNDSDGSTPVDADGDGYTNDIDCDDNNAKIYPGAYDDPGESADANCDGYP